MYFQKWVYPGGSTKIIKFDNGTSYEVSADHNEYVDWLAQGNTAEQVDIAVVQPTASEKWQAIREKRNAMISALDWTQLADSPSTDLQNQAYKTYRQALRDITNPKDDNGQPINNPDDVVWPTL